MSRQVIIRSTASSKTPIAAMVFVKVIEGMDIESMVHCMAYKRVVPRLDALMSGILTDNGIMKESLFIQFCLDKIKGTIGKKNMTACSWRIHEIVVSIGIVSLYNGAKNKFTFLMIFIAFMYIRRKTMDIEDVSQW